MPQVRQRLTHQRLVHQGNLHKNNQSDGKPKEDAKAVDNNGKVTFLDFSMFFRRFAASSGSLYLEYYLVF